MLLTFRTVADRRRADSSCAVKVTAQPPPILATIDNLAAPSEITARFFRRAGDCANQSQFSGPAKLAGHVAVRRRHGKHLLAHLFGKSVFFLHSVRPNEDKPDGDRHLEAAPGDPSVQALLCELAGRVPIASVEQARDVGWPRTHRRGE